MKSSANAARRSVAIRNIGGDFALNWTNVDPGQGSSSLFATGRDALLAILQNESYSQATWLVPEFICPVIPDILRRSGALVTPYKWLTPWSVDADQLRKLADSACGIIVPFYMGLMPNTEVWEVIKGSSLCVIEDRCQCVGFPPSKQELHGDYAIGCFRKWMATPDGAYCVRRAGKALKPSAVSNQKMVETRLAAGLVKQAWETNAAADARDALERTFVELFRLGEELANSTNGCKRSSQIAEFLVQRVDIEAVCRKRVINQSWLAAQLARKKALKILEPQPGATVATRVPMLSIPVLSSRRDHVRRKLAEQRIFCAVHWIDGDWSGQGGFAADMATQILSLPIDQRYELADLKRMLKVL